MDKRKRKLRFRAWRRGFREMDLIMGRFADTYIAEFEPSQLDEFERLLEQADWDVYAWILGKTEIPATYKGPVLDQLIAFRCAALPG